MQLTGIKNFTQRIYGPATFGKKREGAPLKPCLPQTAQEIQRKGIDRQKNENNTKDNGKHFAECSRNYFEGAKISADNNTLNQTMPKDVFLMYKMAEEISKNITDRAPKIEDGFESADITLLFSREGKIIHIFDNKIKSDYKAQKRSSRPLYYGKLKSCAGKETPDVVFNNESALWLETMRFKDGKPASADIHSIKGGKTYRAYFKEGVLSRFEMSEKKGRADKTVQILNFENGRPTSYIRLECPTETSTKNVKWAKLYDLFDDKWEATPPD